MEVLREPTEDLPFVIVGEYYSHYMEFHAYEVYPGRMDCLRDDGEGLKIADVIKEPCDDAALIYGSVKWDGCCNVDFGQGAHFCGLEETRKIGKVFEAIYHLAQRIEHWDY